MNDSIRLGKVYGIPIGVHWSVLFVAWLLAWSLASRLFPAVAPGLPGLAYWAAGAGVALVFFGSLLAHELAHALFARRAGVRVAGITLWLLGGVAKLDGEAPTPGHELRIAASGPIVSAVLGVLFGAVAFALPMATGVSSGASATGSDAVLVLAAEAAAWLARVNLVLAVFNLLPGTPLDGGRIVRAVAWRFGRDRLRASLLAARMGRIVGFGLIGFGVLELVIGADLGGLWTIVIGLFMSGAAAAERNFEVARSALEGLRVRDVMVAAPHRAPAGITVDLFADSVLVADRQSAALVVESDGSIVGVAGVPEVAALSPSRRREARVRDISVPLAAIRVVRPDEPLLAALEGMLTGTAESAGTAGGAAGSGAAGVAGVPGAGAPYLLVVEGADLVGIVTPVELARTVSLRGVSSSRGQSGAPVPGAGLGTSGPSEAPGR